MVKVTKTRLQEAFSAATDGDRPGSETGDRPHEPPMMDMAGALEHLIDYRRPVCTYGLCYNLVFGKNNGYFVEKFNYWKYLCTINS